MSQHGCPERMSNRSKGFQEDVQSQPTMEVLVETLTGTAFEMTVSPSDTIFAIKSKICRVEGIPVSAQHLVYRHRELEDSASLRSLGVASGARLRLVLGMRGGPVSTRRLPPPAPAQPEPWRDIERLLDTAREDGDWSGSSSGHGGGCRVTVLVFRDGERVNMLRVRENRDGTYSPLDQAKYSSSLTHLAEVDTLECDSGSSPPAPPALPRRSGGGEEGAGGGGQNAVTMGKMMELRRRMHSLSVRRRACTHGDKAEIQKTRSEEILSVPSLLDEAGCDPFADRTYTPYSEAEDTFAPLYDGHYTRYDYDCSFADRYTLLPPISTRTDSEQSIHDAIAESDCLKLSDALAGSILVAGRRDARGDDEASILEECLDAAIDEFPIRQDSPQLAAKSLAPIPTAECGPLVCGERGAWRARGYARLPPAPPTAHAHSLSASSLHAHALARPPAPRHHPPLSDALFSSSTSDLEKLKRNRILPALSRHRNREHLHLSDEGLDLRRPTNLEVGSERRQRRIEKIAEMETSRLRFGDCEETKEPEKEVVKQKKLRIRCGLCNRKLSISTVHACRCGAQFCAPHRYAEAHGCAYDYKAAARDPPPAQRLPKI